MNEKRRYIFFTTGRLTLPPAREVVFMSGYKFQTYSGALRVMKTIPEQDRMRWIAKMPNTKLCLRHRNGWRLAHQFALLGVLPQEKMTREILGLKAFEGRTVAGVLAIAGHFPPRFIIPEILALEYGTANIYDRIESDRTVGGILAILGKLPESVMTAEVLSMRLTPGNNAQETIAHDLAFNGNFPPEKLTPEILALDSARGTVALRLLLCFEIMMKKSPHLYPFGNYFRSPSPMTEQVVSYIGKIPEPSLFVLRETIHKFRGNETRQQIAGFLDEVLWRRKTEAENLSAPEETAEEESECRVR